MSIRLLITVVALSWTLSTAALAEPIPLPLGMSIHGETTTNELAEYLFEADGPGMLSVVIRSENGENIAFSVRTASGEALAGGDFNIDFNGNQGAEQGIVVLSVEGEYVITVLPLDGSAEFVMGVSWMPFDEAANGLNGTIVEPIDPTEEAEPILLGEQFEDSIDATEGERERWYSYEADVDGVFVIIVHDSTADMIIQGYNDGEFANPFAYSDEDFGGSGGNEIILMPVREGDVYFFKVSPLSEGSSAEFHVLCEIFPGAEAAAGGFAPGRGGVLEAGIELRAVFEDAIEAAIVPRALPVPQEIRPSEAEAEPDVTTQPME